MINVVPAIIAAGGNDPGRRRATCAARSGAAVTPLAARIVSLPARDLSIGRVQWAETLRRH